MSQTPEMTPDEIVVGSADSLPSPTEIEQGIAEIAQGAASSHGGRIEEVSLKESSAQRVLVILVDRVSAASDPMDLDRIAEVSRGIAEALDESDIMGSAPYELEVSTPGVSRLLTRRRQFELNVGRWLIVKTEDGGKTEGRLLSVESDGIVLQPNRPAKKGVVPKPAEPQNIPFAQMRKAKADVEFADASTAQNTNTQEA